MARIVTAILLVLAAMSSLSVVNCCLLFTLILCIATERADSFEPSTDVRNKQQEATPMWFGPRMGRKKRNPGDKVYRNEKDQGSPGLLDVLRESPLVVVAVSEGKQHNFIPRLGRESGESLPSWLEEAEFLDADSLSSRSTNPFAPRLGRNNFSPFSPRLGRENDSPLK